MNVPVKKVLIVDDEMFVRQSLADYFEDRLWCTIEAESGEQALEILDRESPDGVIVDIRLGGMDGDTFIREAYKKKTTMAFVICTGSPEYNVPKDLLERTGVHDQIFRKPIKNMGEVEQVLSQMIENLKPKKD